MLPATAQKLLISFNSVWCTGPILTRRDSECEGAGETHSHGLGGAHFRWSDRDQKTTRAEYEGILPERQQIIETTANARGEQIAAARHTGTDKVVIKPFSGPDSLAKMCDLLEAQLQDSNIGLGAQCL